MLHCLCRKLRIKGLAWATAEACLSFLGSKSCIYSTRIWPGTRDGMVFRFPRGLVAVSFSMLSPFQWWLGFRGPQNSTAVDTSTGLILPAIALSSHNVTNIGNSSAALLAGPHPHGIEVYKDCVDRSTSNIGGSNGILSERPGIDPESWAIQKLFVVRRLATIRASVH
jgi:hypothetical protein